MKNTLNIIMLSFFLILTGCGPKDYDDCVLQHSKGVNDKYVMERIENSCKEKFVNVDDKKKKCTSSKLTDEELSKIQWLKIETTDYADAYIGGPRLWVTIYNGNEKLELGNAKIKITSPNFPAPQVYEVFLFAKPESGYKGNSEIATMPKDGWTYSVEEVNSSVCK